MLVFKGLIDMVDRLLKNDRASWGAQLACMSTSLLKAHEGARRRQGHTLWPAPVFLKLFVR